MLFVVVINYQMVGSVIKRSSLRFQKYLYLAKNITLFLMQEHTLNINLKQLNKLCKGNEARELKYLKQFLEMISLSIQKLKLATEKGDRTKVMKEIHFMLPQLVFFGVDVFSVLMEHDRKVKGLPFIKLKNQVKKAHSKIEKVLEEVKTIIEIQSNILLNED